MDEVHDLLFLFSRTDEYEDFVKLLEDGKMSVGTIRQENDTTLAHYCAANNSLRILHYIVKNSEKSYFDQKNSSGNSPLHWATLNGNIDCVKVLIEAGCDPLCENSFGISPIDEAVKTGRQDILEYFAEVLNHQQQ